MKQMKINDSNVSDGPCRLAGLTLDISSDTDGGLRIV